MKILSSSQIKELDKFTIEEENISSWDLMERAAMALTGAIKQLYSPNRTFKVFAGPGNNGGDALAIARMLAEDGYRVEVFLFNTKGKLSEDCNFNRELLAECKSLSYFVEITSHFSPPTLYKDDVVIDGLFGLGLDKPLDGGFASVVKYINAAPATVISIDVPSGLMCEDNTYNRSGHIIRASVTLTLQMPKLAFFFAENQPYVGEWMCLDIGLSEKGIGEMSSLYQVTRREEVCALLQPRKEFAHKGNFGHALLIAGSFGMAGASVLAARACLRSGVGLLTVHVPMCNNDILQTAVPEAMVHHDESDICFSSVVSESDYRAIAVGPGLGQREETAAVLHAQLSQATEPMVLDADALNLLAANKSWLSLLPKESILTPHPKEMERLVGYSQSSYDLLEKTRELARTYQVYVVLKGAWSMVVSPDGNCRFNPTGNPGMATAGSGDVLTGVLLSLLAQGYSSHDACLLGVYLHGMAGDLAAEKKGENGMIAGDIVEQLPAAWVHLMKNDYMCNFKEQKCL